MTNPPDDSPDPAVRAAHATCMYLSGSDRFDRPLTQGQKTEILDHLVRFAACLRQHGVDAPDPKADAQGDPSLVLPDSYSIDDPNADFHAPAGAPGASQECAGRCSATSTSFPVSRLAPRSPATPPPVRSTSST
ncbi:MAG TPA: hypothetical protein VG276_26210 [Actinomycetes bacterium]|nr:hypothetical protein [Actinomycetes bacterium]